MGHCVATAAGILSRVVARASSSEAPGLQEEVQEPCLNLFNIQCRWQRVAGQFGGRTDIFV